MMQLRLLKLLFTITLILSQAACAIPSQDYLECNLLNGDQFILISKYNYLPLGALLSNIGDVSVRENQGDYEAYFKPKNGKKTEDPITSANISYQITTIAEMKEVCSAFSMINNQVYVPKLKSGMIIKDGILEFMNLPDYNNFPMIGRYGWKLTEQENAEEQLLLSNTEAEQMSRRDFFDDIDKQRRKQYGLDGSSQFSSLYIGKFDNEMWEEIGFVTINEVCTKSDINCPITAVWQAHSTDNGQTWSAPIITKDAKLFEIGKSILDQPAVAKPGKWKKGPG